MVDEFPTLNPAFDKAWKKPAAEWTEADFEIVGNVIQGASEFTHAISLAGLNKLCGGTVPQWIPQQFLVECINAYGPLYAQNIPHEDIVAHINFLASSPSYAQLLEWYSNPKFSFERFGPVLCLAKLKVITSGSEEAGLIILYGEYDGRAMKRGRKFIGHKLSDAMLKEQEQRDRQVALARFASEWNERHRSGPLHSNASAMQAHLLKLEEQEQLPPYLVGFKLPKATLRKLLAF